MYVPQSAADDDEIEEEAQVSPTQHNDEDDEEPMLQHHLKRLEVSVRSGSTAGGQSEMPASNESVVSLEAVEEPETVVEVPRRPPGDPLPTMTTHEVPATDTIGLAQAVRASSELSPEARAAEQPTASSEIAEKEKSPPAVINGGKVSDVRDGESGAAMELSTTEKVLIPQKTAQSSQETNSASPSRDSAAPLPPANLPVPESTESRKRTIEPTNEERSAKRQRIHVDLTADEDVDMVVVKTEKLEEHDKKTLNNTSEAKSRAKLEARREEIQSRLTEERLKRELAQVNRELEQLDENNQKAAAEQSSAVKIEID
jgi:hypothetical protein